MLVYAPIRSMALDWSIPDCNITDNLDLALAQNFTVAAIPAMCNLPHMYCYKDIPSSLDLTLFDAVMISDIEYYSQTSIQEWIDSQKIKKYILALGGLEHGAQVNPTNTVYRPWWTFNCLRFNKFQDTRHNHKPFQFEMLLGARRPHRDFAMLAFQHHGLLNHSIVTYRDIFQGHSIDHFSQQVAEYFAPTTLQYPYVSPNLDTEWEVTDKINHQISPFIPWEIYRRTNYSILCETLSMGETFFMSEKAAKVLFGKRMFVVFANRYYLQYLKQLGFQTFESVLDESYDLEENFLRRYQLAMSQIQYLNSLDVSAVLNIVQPILDHNHNQLLNLHKQKRTQMISLTQSLV